LSGIFYLHRITDNRRDLAAPLANLKLFEKLVGKSPLGKIILVTTMWDSLNDEEGLNITRENELKKTYWKQMINNGSQMVRFDRNRESGWKIVDNLLNQGNEGGTSHHSLSARGGRDEGEAS
jgi:hypothetical protein